MKLYYNYPDSYSIIEIECDNYEQTPNSQNNEFFIYFNREQLGNFKNEMFKILNFYLGLSDCSEPWLFWNIFYTCQLPSPRQAWRGLVPNRFYSVETLGLVIPSPLG